MEVEHLQAPSSKRASDEASVSFLQWLDSWALNVTPKCDRFHKESRIIFHITIYKVINAFWFPPAFFFPPIWNKGEMGRYLSETML